MVKFEDVTETVLAENDIAKIVYAQCDPDVNQ